jgi:hypothetical protein
VEEEVEAVVAGAEAVEVADHSGEALDLHITALPLVKLASLRVVFHGLLEGL